MAMPGLRLYEDIICHNYHNRLEGKDHIGLDGHIDEEQCKGDEVQNQMNIFLGVLAFLSPMPGKFRRTTSLTNNADLSPNRFVDYNSLRASCR